LTRCHARRRAVQVTQKANALDRALGPERVALDQFTATIAAMRLEVKSDTVVVEARDDSARSATFDVAQAPYTVHAEVELPPSPVRGRLGVRVDLDTLTLEMRIGCGNANALGVRAAEVSAVAPGWARVRLGRVEQTPSVCAPSAKGRSSGGWAVVRNVMERFGVCVGYTATRLPAGVIVGGIGVGVGFRAWS
jgi:hypothetical protein